MTKRERERERDDTSPALNIGEFSFQQSERKTIPLASPAKPIKKKKEEGKRKKAHVIQT